jgi:CrcB protein
MTELAWIVLGGALGGMARFWLSGLVARKAGEDFPWGTLAVNVSGSLAVGILAAEAAAGSGWLAGEAGWPLAITGFLGCYTTVSAFSLQTLYLLKAGERGRAGANIGLSVGLCLLATAAGFGAGMSLFGAG